MVGLAVVVVPAIVADRGSAFDGRCPAVRVDSGTPEPCNTGSRLESFSVLILGSVLTGFGVLIRRQLPR